MVEASWVRGNEISLQRQDKVLNTSPKEKSRSNISRKRARSPSSSSEEGEDDDMAGQQMGEAEKEESSSDEEISSDEDSTVNGSPGREGCSEGWGNVR